MISVIIPVYNTDYEKLERCLSSIIATDSILSEILVVDDGSKCDYTSLERMDPRIHVHQLTHRGVSATRNYGISKAQGKYVAFLDGDDEATPAFLSEAFSIAESQKADCIFGAIQIVNCHGIAQSYQEDDRLYLFSGSETVNMRRALLELQQDAIGCPVLGSPCGRLIRRSLLEHIRFNPDVDYLEDQLFIREVLLSAHTVALINHIWYKYYQYSTSSLHSVKDYRLAALHLPFLAYYNRLNLLEPDAQTRHELCIKSVHSYSSSIRYWVIHRSKKFSDVKKIYLQQHMQFISRQCRIRKMTHRDLFLWTMVRFRLLWLFYFVLRVSNADVQ